METVRKVGVTPSTPGQGPSRSSTLRPWQGGRDLAEPPGSMAGRRAEGMGMLSQGTGMLSQGTGMLSQAFARSGGADSDGCWHRAGGQGPGLAHTAISI